METLLLIVHIGAAAGVIGLVLLQHGKGADMGAAFGSGASGSLFGATGSANFLSRATAVLATVFFVTSVVLTYVSGQKSSPVGLMDSAQESVPVPAAPEVPAQPAGAPSKAKDVPN